VSSKPAILNRDEETFRTEKLGAAFDELIGANISLVSNEA
jgi:hypothetical protein